MKLSLAVTGLLLLLVSATCHAITLKLAPEIDLLVVDGRKMTGSLLKGADSLELDGGQHQLLFRVDKPCADASNSGLLPLRTAGCLLQSADAHSRWRFACRR